MMVMKNSAADPRPSPIAGSWYPADPIGLKKDIEGYLQANPDENSSLLGLIVPHAGYFYSGAVAGRGFSYFIDKTPELVIVLSPCHHPVRSDYLVSDHSHYQTPLGNIPIDKSVVSRVDQTMLRDMGVGLEKIRNDREHSLEIQLPFLQVAVGTKMSLLPIMIRDHDPRRLEHLAKAIFAAVKDTRCLLVISTDLSHFYSIKQANTLDAAMLRSWESFDPLQVFRVAEQGRGEACGLGAVIAGFYLARKLGGEKIKVVAYDTSASSSGEKERVVGYGAAIITA